MKEKKKTFESVKFKILTKIRLKKMAAEQNTSMSRVVDFLIDHYEKKRTPP